MNAEHFAALRLLLDTQACPTAAPRWPGNLPAGEYRCPLAACAMPQLQTLHLCRWAGGPGLATDGSSGFVRTTGRVQHGDRTWECWQIEWDNGSGTLREETLWLDIDSDTRFTLCDAQGRANRYALYAAEAAPELRFWPEPLQPGHYLAQGPAAAQMTQLEWLDVMGEPLLQTPWGMTFLTQMQALDNGSILATVAWAHYDGSEPDSDSRIQLRIHDAQHFTLTDAQGTATAYRWSQDN